MYEEHDFEAVTAVTTPLPRKSTATNDALYILDAQTAPQFKIGQVIHRGETLGDFGAVPVTSFRDGNITSIEYDGWRDQVLVGVRSHEHALNDDRSESSGAVRVLAG